MSVVAEILIGIWTVIKVCLILYGVVLVVGIIVGIAQYLEELEASRPSAPKSTSRSLAITSSQTTVLALPPEEEIYQIAMDTQEKISQRSEVFRQEIYDYMKANA